MISEYIHIHPTSQTTCETGWNEAEMQAKQWYCNECGRLKTALGALDFKISSKKMPSTPLASAAWDQMQFVRTDFLALFDELAVRRDLMLGTLLGPDDKPIEGWVTWRGRHQLQLRGTKGRDFNGPGAKYNGYSYCKTCGLLRYTALGKPFLNPAPNSDVTFLESNLSGLIIPYEVFETIDMPGLRNVGIEQVPVLSPPPDGFGDLPQPGWSHPDRHKKPTLYRRTPF
ncbi:hypothetical protein [Thalassobius sp. I31.1]|uniref:hypothetical protein n=1 Tax=Thalassobius sp. I31.1 TaxID=2109912 RepID=UPI000D1C0F82|nr:hypothetical protein [Thalassobius sp. I31.1]